MDRRIKVAVVALGVAVRVAGALIVPFCLGWANAPAIAFIAFLLVLGFGWLNMPANRALMKDGTPAGIAIQSLIYSIALSPPALLAYVVGRLIP